MLFKSNHSKFIQIFQGFHLKILMTLLVSPSGIFLIIKTCILIITPEEDSKKLIMCVHSASCISVKNEYNPISNETACTAHIPQEP